MLAEYVFYAAIIAVFIGIMFAVIWYAESGPYYDEFYYISKFGPGSSDDEDDSESDIALPFGVLRDGRLYAAFPTENQANIHMDYIDSFGDNESIESIYLGRR